jgi:hypothetical protein
MAFVSVAFGKARTQKMRRENKEARLFRREKKQFVVNSKGGTA